MTPEERSLFDKGVAALDAGRYTDAILTFENAADRGVVDAAASYNRGLAYALRSQSADGKQGDRGQAIHAFEEARMVSTEPSLTKDAVTALRLVRSEIAKQRGRDGDSTEIEPSQPLHRAVADLLPENVWAGFAALSSTLVCLALLFRAMHAGRRARAAATVTLFGMLPVLLLTAGLTFVARDVRLHTAYAVVVTAAARPLDDGGRPHKGQSALPMGARVEVLGSRGGNVFMRWGGRTSWIAAEAVRPLPQPGAQKR